MFGAVAEEHEVPRDYLSDLSTYLIRRVMSRSPTAVCHHPRRDRQIRWAFGTVTVTGILHAGATFESIYLLWI